jgi:RNA polymerase sigma-70 factor (ECF subfamily)
MSEAVVSFGALLALPTRDRSVAGEEPSLIRAALDGDEGAARTLVTRLMPVIHARARRVLVRRGMNPDENLDLVQDVWIGLLAGDGRALRGFDPERGASLEGYVGMIAEREIGNELSKRLAAKRGGRARRETPSRIQSLRSVAASPDEAVETTELAARLGEHLQSILPSRGGLVFRYAFTHGPPPEKVAEILGTSVQAIYNWQHKIRQAAREFLAEESRASSG